MASRRSAGAQPPIREVKRRLLRQLRQQPSVVGVGVEAAGDGGERLKVYLAEDQPALRALVPSEIDGYAVTIEVIGRIGARAGAHLGDRGTLA